MKVKISLSETAPGAILHYCTHTLVGLKPRPSFQNTTTLKGQLREAKYSPPAPHPCPPACGRTHSGHWPGTPPARPLTATCFQCGRAEQLHMKINVSINNCPFLFQVKLKNF